MTECKLCKSKKIKLIKHGVRDNANIDVYKCQKCGLEFLSQCNQADEDFYAKGCMHSSYVVENWLKNTYVDDKRRAEYLKELIKNKEVLDFGTGNGGFLIHSKSIAKAICGHEIDNSLIEHYAKHGLEVKNNLGNCENKFDVITMFHVLEHVENPQKVLQNLKKYLNKNGRLVIEVPNSEDALLTMYNSEAFKKITYWSCHLYAYNISNLKIILKNAGYKIKVIDFIQRYPYTNHVGWLKDKKAGGHRVYKANKFVNLLYTHFLKLLHKTDTIIVIAEPIL